MSDPTDQQLRDSDRYLRGEACWAPPPANDDDEGVPADRLFATLGCVIVLGLITAGVVVLWVLP